MATAKVTLTLTPTEYRVICSALRDYYQICDMIVTEEEVNVPTPLTLIRDQRQVVQERERVKALREKLEPIS